MDNIDPSEITAEAAYLSRRKFLKRAGLMALGTMTFGACARRGPVVMPATARVALPGLVPPIPALTDPSHVDELGNPVTMLHRVNTYGHYYEFTRNRLEVHDAVGNYEPPPLRIEAGGLVRNPQVFELDDLRQFGEETRIYRLRCLEAWAMVVPWTGFPLRRLLEVLEPMPDAKFVRFAAIHDPDRLPGQRPGAYLDALPTDQLPGMGASPMSPYTWPYAEGLRLDEAMHDLTMIVTGMYGKPLTAVNGAPVRLIVPWKYAHKSIKSLVKIELVAAQPATFWNAANPSEYGFWSNVNPSVPHPRWAQVKEVRYRGACPERIVPTLMFNGYGDQVAHLYDGMDLGVYF